MLGGGGGGKSRGKLYGKTEGKNKTKGGDGKTTPSSSMLDRWHSPDLTMHWVRIEDQGLGTRDLGSEDSAADTGPTSRSSFPPFRPRHHREMKTTQAKIQSYFYCRLVGCISRRAQGSGHIAEGEWGYGHRISRSITVASVHQENWFYF